MAIFNGRLGAIYARTGTTDLSGIPLSQVGTTDEYVIANLTTRMRRAFDADAEIADFTTSSGTVTAIKKPVGSVVISGGTPPYTLSSANNAVATLAPLGGFVNWRMVVDASVVDVSELGSDHRVFRRLQHSWDGAADRFWIDENFTVDVSAGMNAVGDDPFVVSFVVNTDADKAYRYVGFASVDGMRVDAPVAELVGETIRLRGSDKLYFRRFDN